MEMQEMIVITLLHPHATINDLGLLPGFLNLLDPRPAKEQFDEKYSHGGGWLTSPTTFKLDEKGLHAVEYGEHFFPIAEINFRNERIILHDCSYVAIVQEDGTFEVARMD
jgi:hypothetical protein